MEETPFRDIPERPFREVPETMFRSVPELRCWFRNPRNCSGIPETSVLESRGTRFHIQSSGVRNPGGSKLRSVPESGIPESVPESRNPGNSGISEKLDFDLFVGEQGGMKISTAVSTLFRGLAEAVRGCSYCSGIILLRDNIAPG